MNNSNPLIEQSIDSSVCVVAYYKWLCAQKKEFVMSKQLLKSGTSIGANVHEANLAISKADFISKMQIALKEASESEYWLLVLERTEFLPDEYMYLKEKCNGLKRMLIATLNTTKNN